MNNARFFFVLLAIAAALGIGSIWSLPYISFRASGIFFIHYFIALLILGMPLLMLELSIGQYFNKNVVDLFASIRKRFSSIGWIMLFNAFIVMGVYAVILSWHIIYLFASIGLQWKHDPKSYFFNNVIQASEGFSSFTQFSLPVFIASILAWVLIFVYIKKGYDGIKKAILASSPLFIILLLVFLMGGLTLENALQGVYSFLRPEWQSLMSVDVWLDALYLVILSSGISFGVMHSIGRRGKGFILGASFYTIVSELLIGIAIGIFLFSMLGFMSAKIKPLENLVFAGHDYQFTTLSQSLQFFYQPTLSSMLFFVFLSIFYIFGAALLAYSISHVLVHKFSTKRLNAAIFVSGFGFLLGFLFFIRPGFYIMEIMSHYIIYNLLIAALLESIAVGWFFESERISAYINQNSLIKLGKLWRFFIRYIVPFILIIMIFAQIRHDVLFYDKYPLLYVIIFGIGIVVLPITLAFFMPQKLLDRK